MINYADFIAKELKSFAKPEKAAHMASFFKTGRGEYAEGDVFWGITTPEMRAIVKKYYSHISLPQIQCLLDSPIHEQRSAGLQCLVYKFAKANKESRDEIVTFYLQNTVAINNWDLVDTTAPYILGAWGYENNNTERNWQLAHSGKLWEERIAVVSTIYFIRNNIFEPTVELAERFLNHKHNLMHKAVGWMLREVGKRNEKVLIDFLDKYAKKMPRTMLRYSLERLTPEQQRYYMQK